MRSAREHMRRYEERHSRSVVERIQSRLGSSVAQLRAILGLNDEAAAAEATAAADASRGSAGCYPMPADRPEVVDLMAALTDVKERIRTGGKDRFGWLRGSVDGPAMDVIQTATELVGGVGIAFLRRINRLITVNCNAIFAFISLHSFIRSADKAR